MKINIGSNFKKYHHKYDTTNNTSFGFGEVQPLFTRYMLPESTINVNLSQFVRLMPMPYPTFANVKLKSVARFVPIGDIYEAFDSFLSGLPFKPIGSTTGTNSYVINKLPFITNCELQQILLSNPCSYFQTWCSTQTTKDLITTWSEPVRVTDSTDSYYRLPPVVMPAYFNAANNQSDQFSSYPEVTLQGADYIFKKSVSVDGVNKIYYYCFRYTEQGKRLRKLFIGLGYNPMLEDTTSLSVLPLLAYYKAYFEVFNPNRTLNFQDTTTFNIIGLISSVATYINAKESVFSLNNLALNNLWITELSNAFATNPTDWFSLHTSNLLNIQDNSLPSAVSSNGIGNVIATANNTQLPFTSVTNAPNIKLLQRITSLFSQQSVLGQKVSSWINQKYGAEISNQIYSVSNSCGDMVTRISISDVDSLSDTMSVSDGVRSGSELGAYAGKGLGSDNGQFSFTTKKHGYFIILSYIVPEQNYFQGSDPSLFALQRDEIPTPVYDSIGFELTPKSALFTDNGISTYDKNSKDAVDINSIDDNSSFGYIPRYSGFKTCKSIVNGDLSRKGVITDMQCFYLDKMLTARTLVTKSNKVLGHNYLGVASNYIPNASESWRYIMRYPWLQNYNRMFYNFDDNENIWYSWDLNSHNYLDDNFIVHNAFEVSETNYLKPISESYDTFIDEVNTSSKNVQSV